MKKNQEYKSTTNRYIYNRLRKDKLSGCSFCRWHGNFYHFSENDNWEDYLIDGRKPNWKLVSKNKKQWMKKPYKIYSHFNPWMNKTFKYLRW